MANEEQDPRCKSGHHDWKEHPARRAPGTENVEEQYRGCKRDHCDRVDRRLRQIGKSWGSWKKTQ